jgi:hypothetical protein
MEVHLKIRLLLLLFWWVLVALLGAGIALLGRGIALSNPVGAANSPSTFTNYVPIYVPTSTEVYDASGAPILDLRYVKQSNQVDFMACANLIGDGVWALTYPEAGDPVTFHYSTYTWACIHTLTGVGGGTIGFPLQLWLQQEAGATAHVATPNIFVSTSGLSTPANQKP